MVMACFAAARYSLPRFAETENDRWVVMRNAALLTYDFDLLLKCFSGLKWSRREELSIRFALLKLLRFR